jgi:hypothetical protein
MSPQHHQASDSSPDCGPRVTSGGSSCSSHVAHQVDDLKDLHQVTTPRRALLSRLALAFPLSSSYNFLISRLVDLRSANLPHVPRHSSWADSFNNSVVPWLGRGAAMANVDFGRYKQKLVRYFWDPEPTNNETSKSPIWCLGQEYRPTDRPSGPNPASRSPPGGDSTDSVQEPKPATPPDSTTSSFDSGLAYEEARNAEEGGGWPPSFLDDFEARIWMTYRSSFPAIPKSQDPSAYSAMSFSVRIKSQLVDQAGFTSDTGWGCMIRSGQSLLANALVMLRMGRGQTAQPSWIIWN